ncbi:MAG TPA: hypothetical protein VKM93_04635 [Terriglobia bacterium]|nr:hypothetical protein [Terriglobia bacterium]
MLLQLAEQYGWQLQSWAVFPNHYHFVPLATAKDVSLTEFLRHLHSVTAIEINHWDEAPGVKRGFNIGTLNSPMRNLTWRV